PRQFTWDGRNDDLECLEPEEDERRQDPPLAQHLLEEVFVDVQADQELVDGGIRRHEPEDGAADGRSDKNPDDPRDPRGDHAASHGSQSRPIIGPSSGSFDDPNTSIAITMTWAKLTLTQRAPRG